MSFCFFAKKTHFHLNLQKFSLIHLPAEILRRKNVSKCKLPAENLSGSSFFLEIIVTEINRIPVSSSFFPLKIGNFRKPNL